MQKFVYVQSMSESSPNRNSQESQHKCLCEINGTTIPNTPKTQERAMTAISDVNTDMMLANANTVMMLADKGWWVTGGLVLPLPLAKNIRVVLLSDNSPDGNHSYGIINDTKIPTRQLP